MSEPSPIFDRRPHCNDSSFANRCLRRYVKKLERGEGGKAACSIASPLFAIIYSLTLGLKQGAQQRHDIRTRENETYG